MANEIELIINKLNVLAAKQEEMKLDMEKQLDKMGNKLERVELFLHSQEKSNLQQDMKMAKCEENIQKIDGKLATHLDTHMKNIPEEVEKNAAIKHRLGLIWAVGIFIISQIGLLIFTFIKNFLAD